jgi:hypothetical protein
LLVAVLGAPLACAQGRGTLDEKIVREAQLVASGTRVELYQHGLQADPALVATAERALARMEELLGRKLDEPTLGPRVRIYVAASTAVSHVWRGYGHRSDPQARLFLNARVAQLALGGSNATYAHELAHLLTWRFHSHTLREGLADWLALQLHPHAAVGPNAYGNESSPFVPAEIEDYLGTTRAPPGAVISEAYYRRAYYFASYRFVRFLMQRSGMATFLQLYDSEDPESAFPRLYGADRKELAAASAR